MLLYRHRIHLITEVYGHVNAEVFVEPGVMVDVIMLI